MTIVDFWTLFAAQNPTGQTKVFLRKFYVIWVLALQKARQPSLGRREGRLEAKG